MQKENDTASSLLPLIPFVFFLAVFYAFLQPIQGKIGHDYYHAIPRLLIGAVHFWQNGMGVPHFTPSLCGGLPLFADPQSYYYSVPQAFTIFLDPLLASQLSILLFLCLGYWGAFWCLRSELRHSLFLSHTGSLLFVCNGFSFAHLFVGHLTHHTYLLISWVLYFVLKSRRRVLFGNAVWFSFVWIYTFYSGGVHMIVVFIVSLLLVLPLLITHKNAKSYLILFGITGLIFLFTLSGKFVASFLYSQNFHEYPVTRVGGETWKIPLQYFWFNPFQNPQYGPYGPWETIGFVSRLSLPAVLLLLIRQIRAFSTLRGFYILWVVIWILVGCGYGANPYLPFLKHYHNPIKILSAFIPLILYVAVLFLGECVEFFKVRGSKTRVLFYILSYFVLLEFVVYAHFFRQHGVGIIYSYTPNFYQALSKIRSLPVVEEVVSQGRDDQVLVTGKTSLSCYEPVFGYRHEKLSTALVPGATDAVSDGRFNLNQPGCLIYPKFYGCENSWERFSVKDKKMFQAFREGKSILQIPFWQTVLIWGNGISILGLVVFTVLNVFYSKKNEKNGL